MWYGIQNVSLVHPWDIEVHIWEFILVSNYQILMHSLHIIGESNAPIASRR